MDLIGSVELGGINFIGGTLFFDGSIRVRANQMIDEWDGWQDSILKQSICGSINIIPT